MDNQRYDAVAELQPIRTRHGMVYPTQVKLRARSVAISKATLADAEAMSAGLNGHQRELILSIGGETVYECMRRSLSGSSYARSARVDDELIAVWGCYQIDAGTGYPWMFSAASLGDNPKLTLTIARRVIDEMLAIYPRLFGVVDSGFPESVRFARHLGFSIGAYPFDPPLVAIERLAT